jgi:hypothetical protein
MSHILDLVTVVIPTSPIPSHPSSSLILQTIRGIRYHLPEVEILFQADGVRQEQEKFRLAYNQYIAELEFWCSVPENNSCMIDFRDMGHLHQAAMMKKCFQRGEFQKPLIFYMEHDFLLTTDPIDFTGIAQTVLSGEVNLMRLHYWSQIVPEHRPLMLDEKPRISVAGVPYIRTTQYSQHPHIATKEFYQKLLWNYSDNCRTMIETRAYGLVANSPWEDWKCAIYTPEPNLKRIIHIHGREEESKFEDTFTF